MNTDLIHNITERTPRKSILVPLAESLNINHKNFKNRKSLIKEIQRVCPPSKRCENKEDFITLCPIDDIPHERMFIWTQNKKTFGADIISLKQYIDSGKTMNPWCIDYATGVQDAKNRDLYLKQHDMSKQKGLLQQIENKYKALNIDENLSYETNSDNENIFRFELEKYADEINMYISHILTAIESMSLEKYIYITSIVTQRTLDYFIATQNNSDSKEVKVLYDIHIQTNCLHLILNNNDKKPSNIKLLLDLIKFIDSFKQEFYSAGVIQYIFMEFDLGYTHYT